MVYYSGISGILWYIVVYYSIPQGSKDPNNRVSEFQGPNTINNVVFGP